MILVSIDPGLRGCGCAAWRDGKLVSAAYVESCDPTEPDLGNAVELIGMAVEAWIDDQRTGKEVDEHGHVKLVIEYPQTYGGRASRGDSNDLISIAMVVGAIVGRVGEPRTFIRPAEWKGQVPKQTKHGTNPIELRCRAKLSAAELRRVDLPKRKSLQHNTWDAVGVGLFALDR